MGRKNIVPSYLMLDAADMSANATSSIVNVQNMDKASIHVYWAGTSPVGTMTVEARNGANEPWFALDMGSPITISGNTGFHELIFNEVPFTDIRLQYDATSGAGTLNSAITLKQVGG